MGLFPLWAVHISDGMLSWPWLLAGFALAGALALLSAYRVRDEEIPRIALLSAAFFVCAPNRTFCFNAATRIQWTEPRESDRITSSS